MRLMIK